MDSANPELQADKQALSTLQSKLDRCTERRRALAQQLRPIRKRLQKHMEDHDLNRLQCVNYVLATADPDSDPDNDPNAGDAGGEGEAVFTQKRVAAFLSSDQLQAYCAANQRPPKRRRKTFTCERDVIDIAESDGDAPA